MGIMTIKILQFVKDFIDKYNYPPTREEIRAGCGLKSKSNVQYHLMKLQDSGQLELDTRTARGIRVIEK
jgi:repressor LexA